jgi:Tol biopolymer transport system component
MSIIRLIGSCVVVLGMLLIPSLGCASQPGQAPATPPTPAQTPVLTAPVLSSPSNTGTIQGITVKLEWQPSTGATAYSLQIATDSTFSKPVTQKTDLTNNYFELTSGLAYKTSYYWRVNASNASGTSSWSESWQFNTPVFKVGKMVFNSGVDNRPQIYIMDENGSNWKRLTDSKYYDLAPKLSPDGTKIAFASNRIGGNYQVYVMNADGSNQAILTSNIANSMGESAPSWSPDGTKIAFVSISAFNSIWDLYIMNADGTNPTRITNNALAESPSWSPDGAKIAFASKRDGHYEIYVMNIDGSNQTRLTNNSEGNVNPSWSPDDTKIAFHSKRDGYWAIYVMSAAGNNQARLTNNSAGDSNPSWSPDGSKIAFESYRDGNGEIYVMNADGSNQIKLFNRSGARSGNVSWR